MRQIPLAGVVPLRRTNFAPIITSVPDTEPSAEESRTVVFGAQNSEAVRQTEAVSQKVQPVYAATFHGDKNNIVPETSSEKARALLTSQITTEDFPLPRYTAPEDRKLVVKPKNWFKLMSRFAVAGIAAVFLASGFFAWHSYARSSGLAEAASNTAILSSAHVSPERLTKEGDARINILLLGIGGEGHNGADLSDTMVLASIDPVNKTTVLLSIPRDLWVEMPNEYFGNHQKINAVYSAGKYQYYREHGKSDEKAAVQAGLAAVDTVVEQVLGIPIQYHAVVDFKAFKQAVDAVGTITVDVKTPLVDPTMAWENGGNATLAQAGIQQMDGEAALRYVRSRHTSSDFARSTRQREILVALRKKILTTGTLANPLKLQQLLATFGNNVFTDISTVDLVRLYGLTSGIDESAITSLDLVTGEHALVRTDTVGSVSVVRPKLGFDRYSDIQTYVRSQLRDGYLVKEHAGVMVAASSEEAAGAAKGMLSDLGYTVLSTAVTAQTDTQKTSVVDMSNGLSPYTRHYLDKRYGGKFTEKLPKGLVVPDGTQFVILVGE
jgi:LCP family protein required for cell wall assembly